LKTSPANTTTNNTASHNRPQVFTSTALTFI
jgi:hypothetical protein